MVTEMLIVELREVLRASQGYLPEAAALLLTCGHFSWNSRAGQLRGPSLQSTAFNRGSAGKTPGLILPLLLLDLLTRF